MKQIFLKPFSICVISAALLFNKLNSQNIITNGNTFPMVGYWTKGTTKKVTNTTTKTKVKNNKTTTTTYKSESTWKIADSTSTSYVIHYKLNDFSSSDNDSFILAYAQVFKGITLKYCTNELGTFDSIINLKEVSAIAKRGIDNAFKLLKWPENETVKGIKANLKNVVNNLNNLRVAFEEELHIIHYCYGAEFQLNNTYTFDAELPSYFGGNNYPSKVKMKLISISKPTDRIKFSGTITPNQETYQKLLFENLSIFHENLGLPKPLKTDLPKYSTMHKYEATYTLNEAWPILCTYTKIDNTKDTKNTETISISFN